MLKKIKVRYIWIAIIVVFLMVIGLIIGITFTDQNWKMPLIIALTICFVFLTFAVQYATYRSFQYKKKIKYPEISYTTKVEDLSEKLESLKYEKRIVSYGLSYLKISGGNAYKVALVKDVKKYFSQTDAEMEQSTPNKALDKCKKFIGFEIFYDYDEDTLRKMPDFTIQGEKVYYTALYYDNEKKAYKCLNYEKPQESFAELYQKVLSDLEMIELTEEVK